MPAVDGSSGSAAFDDEAAAKSALVEHYDEQYARGGFGYDERRAHWLAWSREHYVDEFRLAAGETLLDVGCGDGFWTGIFATLGLRPTGIDISPGGIAIARKRHPELVFDVADVDRPLSFPAESFDVVFCRGLTQLARRDLFSEANLALVQRLVSHVAPGGLLLISYSTKRRGGGPPEHPHHPASDLVRLLETAADPYHLDLSGNALQIAAQRWDAPCRRATNPRGSGGGARPDRIAGRIARRIRDRRAG
jgi:SAM-dependent methyltransferase